VLYCEYVAFIKCLMEKVHIGPTEDPTARVTAW